MKIFALQCLECGDIIFSRCRHDYRICTCGKIGVDGGQGNEHIFRTIGEKANIIELWFDLSIKGGSNLYGYLYTDWTLNKNQLGLIKFVKKKTTSS